MLTLVVYGYLEGRTRTKKIADPASTNGSSACRKRLPSWATPPKNRV